MSDSFVISEESSLVPGYVTCLVLNFRPHGDWVMSYCENKGAIPGIVSVLGQKPAQQSLPNFCHTLFANRKASRQNRELGPF